MQSCKSKRINELVEAELAVEIEKKTNFIDPISKKKGS